MEYLEITVRFDEDALVDWTVDGVDREATVAKYQHLLNIYICSKTFYGVEPTWVGVCSDTIDKYEIDAQALIDANIIDESDIEDLTEEIKLVCSDFYEKYMDEFIVVA